ncbi:MAG: PHP domain-containing protein [Candidatus Diapherotrites archaeon]|uniref:Polymerase/histidinol phosphatase N-terminal domain-containing protein n=1 Tax=Candidatus Iainarchaeum sp. TaxID=3101447 RepID=A0A497JHM2_9ARCH|nr:PHP domain-containing protein [Candidatus Diapherotrites archaeon]RLG69938.1 MAG: hypothetical protein DRO07_01350 [Candidatus Diapherotrites archaeon]
MMNMKAELHCHTNYSKGTKIKVEGLHSPEEMVRQAKLLGIDVLAITDHNKFKGAVEAEKVAKKYDIIVIKGEEITTDRDKHVIGLGLSELIPQGLSLGETLDRIREQGGIAVAPHPFDINNKGLGKLAMHCDAIEAFNSINKDRLSNRKARKFAKKHAMPMVAGSDAHCKEMLGYGLTKIYAEPDVDSILIAIKRGNTKIYGRYIPTDVIKKWSLARIEYSYFSILEYIAENYSYPKRFVCEKLLNLTKHSPGKIDYLFDLMAYFGVVSATFYSLIKTPFRN